MPAKRSTIKMQHESTAAAASLLDYLRTGTTVAA